MEMMRLEFQDQSQELKRIQAEAKQKIESLQQDGESMSPDEVEKLRVEIAQLDSKFKIQAQALEKASKRRQAEEEQKLSDVLREVIAKVAAAEGYDMVLDSNAVPFAKPEYDLSDKVLQSLEQEA